MSQTLTCDGTYTEMNKVCRRIQSRLKFDNAQKIVPYKLLPFFVVNLGHSLIRNFSLAFSKKLISLNFLFRLSIRKQRNICARGGFFFLQTNFDFLTSHF